MVDVQKQKD